jgi:BCD family chlorophyll transporter-like MFS transporter
MYVVLLLGMMVSAFIFGLLLENYNPAKLIQVIQGAAVVTVALNLAAMWKMEARNRQRAEEMKTAVAPSFKESWGKLTAVKGALRLLIVIALGTAGFGMADVLLEPYGGQVLGMTVAQTTRLTVVLAFGSLVGFGLASRLLGRRGASPLALAWWGGLVGVAAFAMVVWSAATGAPATLIAATLVAGFGAGLFSHGTLTATMRAAPRDQIGLALGAWGAVQTTAAGVAIAIGGIVRDVVVAGSGDATLPYLTVFVIEIVLLAAAIVVAFPIMRRELARLRARKSDGEPDAPMGAAMAEGGSLGRG